MMRATANYLLTRPWRWPASPTRGVAAKKLSCASGHGQPTTRCRASAPKAAARFAHVIIASCVTANLALPAPTASACTVHHEERRVVTGALAADVLVLETGEQVKLVGLYVPTALQFDARAALAAFVGKPVDLAAAGVRKDRYGRWLAQVFLVDAPADAPPAAQPNALPDTNAQTASATWLQGALVTAGLARAASVPGQDTCFDELMAREATARTERRGHWATGGFSDRSATAIFDLAALSDTFQTIVGEIRSVKPDRSRSSLVLTFDTAAAARARADEIVGNPQLPRSSRAFRVFVPNAAAATLTPPDRPTQIAQPKTTTLEFWNSLVGQEVRVRGWIELQNGEPRVTINHAREIERLTPATTAPLTGPTSPPDTTPPEAPPPKIRTRRNTP